jgi:hypothetical protein
MPVMQNVISMLVTGGGNISCRRCTVLSKRSGEQCKKPALKTSQTQKCDFHGGRSTGPKTGGGKVRQRAAVTTSGRYTKEAMEGRARMVEDAGYSSQFPYDGAAGYERGAFIQP